MASRARSKPRFRVARRPSKIEKAAAPSKPPEPWTFPADELARILSLASGQKVDAAAIRADVKSGAPRRSGGAVNLIAYTAWLLKESAGGD